MVLATVSQDGAIQVAQNVGFGLIAALMVPGAINVVRSSNVVHAALSLVAVMAGAAAQYLLLAAEFVAVTQVLVYIGAVMILFLFGVMLTRARVGRETDLNNKGGAALGGGVAVLLLGVLSYVLIKGFKDDRLVVSGKGNNSAAINVALSDRIFSSYALPFWALSFVLLAAVIGAIVLARKD
jgi:NADH-quinone oxidoreductase subunit J